MGGMGIVVQCNDLEDGRVVALKSFRPDLIGHSAARRRFLEEARRWIRLGTHPNIVQAYRVEQMGSPPQPYLVMEWVQGRQGAEDPSLFSLLLARRRRPLGFLRTLALGLDIARGMRHATREVEGLVHCDLKPENILVDAGWHARITDFGIARIIDEMPHEPPAVGPTTDTGKGQAAVFGTGGYIAPEIFEAPGDIDQRADIFSFGCLLYQMLTGYRLMPGKSPAEILAANQSGQTRAIPEALPDCLKRLIRGCIERRPKDRYRDWIEVVAALDHAYREIAGHEAPPEEAITADTSTGTGEGITTRIAIAESYANLGFSAEAAKELGLALELASKAGARTLEAEIHRQLGRIHLDEGDYGAAAASLEAALLVARDLDDPLITADVQSIRGALYTNMGLHDEAIAILMDALATARSHGCHDLEAIVLGNLGGAHGQAGDPARARDYFSELMAWCDASGDDLLRSRTLASLGVAHYDLKDFPKAIEYLEQALELTRRRPRSPARARTPGQGLHGTAT